MLGIEATAWILQWFDNGHRERKRPSLLVSAVYFQEREKAAQIQSSYEASSTGKVTDMVCTLLNCLSYVLEPSLIAKNILWDFKRRTTNSYLIGN